LLRKSQIADGLNYAAYALVISGMLWILYLDSAIWRCGEIGGLSPFLLYLLLLIAFFLGGAARWLAGRRKSGLALFPVLLVLAIAPFFLETYGYGGPACKTEQVGN
jgi:hypothetical protein